MVTNLNFQAMASGVKKWFIPCACILLSAVSGEASAQSEDKNYFRLEANVPSGDDSQFINVGGVGFSGNLTGHIDFSYVEADEDGKAFGADLGGGYTFKAGLDFVIGAGLLLAYNTDNGDFVTTWYPQLGVVARIVPSFGFSITAKHFADLYGRSEDIVMLGLLFAPP